MTTFWQAHQVGGPYSTLEASRRALKERALLYPMLYDLMPVNLPGQVILDYGCGPGHDTILFLENGAGHVFYYDASEMAMEITEERLGVHGSADRASPVVEWNIPKVDHVHCAGVLHHTEDPMSILKDFRSLIKADGEIRIMVYDGDLSTHTQSDVPITYWWTKAEFALATRIAGLIAEHVGSYPCSAPWRPDCFAACYRCRSSVS